MIVETIRLALLSVRRNVLRSFLTLLGMIIGMTAFMVVLSLLQGFNFNKNAPLEAILKTTYVVDSSLNDIIIQDFIPAQHLSYPDAATIPERRAGLRCCRNQR